MDPPGRLRRRHSRVGGTKRHVEEIELLAGKYQAVAGDWESGAIAYVSALNRTRCLILRGVSDLVGGDGGEVYGNEEMFRQRASMVMEKLVRMLPQVLAGAAKQSTGRSHLP